MAETTPVERLRQQINESERWANRGYMRPTSRATLDAIATSASVGDLRALLDVAEQMAGALEKAKADLAIALDTESWSLVAMVAGDLHDHRLAARAIGLGGTHD